MFAQQHEIEISQLQQRLGAMMPEALDVLRQLVSINSFTRNAVGVNRVGELMWQLFEPMGFALERRQAVDCLLEPRPQLGSHLFLTRPGNRDCRIGMVGHLDTVFTEQDEQEHDFHWRVCGDRIYGPGVVDMKGGNVLLWMVLRALNEVHPRLFNDINWVVMFNAAEEGLDSDFGYRQREHLGPAALANLIFEGGEFHGGQYRLVTQRKGGASFKVSAHGRAAHAGIAHADGANAVVQLCQCITQMHALTDYDRELTADVSVVRGGVTLNRVPDYATAEVGLRAYDQSVLNQAIAEVLAMDGLSTVTSHTDGFAARVRVVCTKNLPAWPSNAQTDRLLAIWQQAGAYAGLKVASSKSGGRSDGNFSYDLAPTLDGLGPAGGNLHCAARSADGQMDQEYVLPETFVPFASMSVLGIERLLQQHLLRSCPPSHTSGDIQ